MKPPTTSVKLFTKQSVPENNSFHLPSLPGPVLDLFWDVWIWERAWQIDFRYAQMNIYNLDKKHTCSGISHLSAWKFPTQIKAIYRPKESHRHRETHTVLLTSFIFFLPPFCSSVNLFSYWRESVDRRCACEDEKKVSKVQKMLFRVIAYLIYVFSAVKLGNPVCETIQESATSQHKLF